jgi:subtilisin family serine protease
MRFADMLQQVLRPAGRRHDRAGRPRGAGGPARAALLAAAVATVLPAADAEGQAPAGLATLPAAQREALKADLAGPDDLARDVAVPGQYIVNRAGGQGAAMSSESLMQATGAALLATDSLTGLDLVEVESEDELSRLTEALGAGAVVPNYYLYAAARPDDAHVDRMWMIDAIRADRAWAVHDDASSVTVAVIDDAVHLDHEDLRENIWTNPGEIPGNGRDDDGNGFVDDVHGWDFADNDNDPNPDLCGGSNLLEGEVHDHGTHVAGTVGAVGGNGVGVVGVAPKVRIMALKVAPGERCDGFPLFSVLRAVIYAVRNGARVANMSLGSPMASGLERAVLEFAGKNGLLIVTAAGNNGIDNDSATPVMYYSLFPGVSLDTEDGPLVLPTRMRGKLGPSYPASFDVPEILTVAATAPPEDGAPSRLVRNWSIIDGLFTPIRKWVGLKWGPRGLDLSEATALEVGPEETWNGSNYGRVTVDIAAPGKAIASTVPQYSAGGLVSGYAENGGTSMAAPHVAGAAALLLSAFPEMTPREVKERLMTTARPLPDLADKVASGGQLDLLAALCAEGAPRRLEGCGEDAAPATAGTVPAPQVTVGTPAPGAAAPEAGRAATAMPEPVFTIPDPEGAQRDGPGTAPAEDRGSVNVNDLFD